MLMGIEIKRRYFYSYLLERIEEIRLRDPSQFRRTEGIAPNSYNTHLFNKLLGYRKELKKSLKEGKCSLKTEKLVEMYMFTNSYCGTENCPYKELSKMSPAACAEIFNSGCAYDIKSKSLQILEERGVKI